MNPESFKGEAQEKLYIVKSIEGKPNREELKVIRDFEKEFSKHPAFIGLSPFGSVVSGYNTENKHYHSDIDAYLLFDGEKRNQEEDNRNYLITRDIDTMKNTLLENGVEVNFWEAYIDLSGIVKTIDGFENGKNNFPAADVAILSRITTGKKIDDYRKEIASRLHQLPAEKKQEAFHKILDHIMQWDQFSIDKRKARIPQLSDQDWQDIAQSRREMWSKRLEKIWEIQSE